ncbi:MAG: hypothetical protein ACRDQ4_16205 [Pseudonocardiaceae bacterium]
MIGALGALSARIPETKYASVPSRAFNSWGAPAMIAASKPTPAITRNTCSSARSSIVTRPTSIARFFPDNAVRVARAGLSSAMALMLVDEEGRFDSSFSVTIAPTFTSETTLGDVRGKIVLLRRFQSGRDAGFDVTYWLDNAITRSSEDVDGKPRSAVPPVYHIEDHHNDPDDKYDLIVSHIEKAKRGDRKDLYITFSSAVALRASGYAETINPRLNDYLSGSPTGRVEIIVMDYWGFAVCRGGDGM